MSPPPQPQARLPRGAGRGRVGGVLGAPPTLAPLQPGLWWEMCWEDRQRLLVRRAAPAAIGHQGGCPTVVAERPGGGGHTGGSEGLVGAGGWGVDWETGKVWLFGLGEGSVARSRPGFRGSATREQARQESIEMRGRGKVGKPPTAPGSSPRWRSEQDPVLRAVPARPQGKTGPI